MSLEAEIGTTGLPVRPAYTVTFILDNVYYIIVPDCRGHGQSDNPHHSYSFFEMAADVAGLIRAPGYERAHVIGHSNDGNIALVTWS